MGNEEFFMGRAEAPTDILDELNRELYERARSEELSDSVSKMITLHITKPWVLDFKSIVISPLKENLEEFLAVHIFDWQEVPWFFPSDEWWMSHAKVSHSPGNGLGCNLKNHVDFLTNETEDGEFLYANILKSGDAYILGRSDFEEECEYWNSFTQEKRYR